LPQIVYFHAIVSHPNAPEETAKYASRLIGKYCQAIRLLLTASFWNHRIPHPDSLHPAATLDC